MTTAATFPDQRTGTLAPEEIEALWTLSFMGHPHLRVADMLDAPDEVHTGLDLLRLRGWARLRDWPRMPRTRWEMTPRGLREAVGHQYLSRSDEHVWLWRRLLVRWLAGGAA